MTEETTEGKLKKIARSTADQVAVQSDNVLWRIAAYVPGLNRLVARRERALAAGAVRADPAHRAARSSRRTRRSRARRSTPKAIMRRLSCGEAKAREIVRLADASFAQWPEERDVNLRDVVNYVIVHQIMTAHSHAMGTLIDMDEIVKAAHPRRTLASAGDGREEDHAHPARREAGSQGGRRARRTASRMSTRSACRAGSAPARSRSGSTRRTATSSIRTSRPPDHLYAARYHEGHHSKRCYQTLLPLSEKLGIDINIKFLNEEFAEMVAHAKARDGVVLISWHHEKIPEVTQGDPRRPRRRARALAR